MNPGQIVTTFIPYSFSVGLQESNNLRTATFELEQPPLFGRGIKLATELITTIVPLFWFFMVGKKGMMVAAKTLSLTAMEIFNNPNIAAKALKELNIKRGENFQYEALLGDRKPPLDYRK